SMNDFEGWGAAAGALANAPNREPRSPAPTTAPRHPGAAPAPPPPPPRRAAGAAPPPPPPPPSPGMVPPIRPR
ncbi:hypothetical protein, partial [Nocardia farcinica]|uniref:hypothetical protein n=1 Tax=Nocardia farcinica TaxID=37329 RepID=UPI002455C46B